MGWFDKLKKNKKKEKIEHPKHKVLPKKVLAIIRKYAKLGYTNAEIADEIEKSGLLDYRVAEPTISSRVATSGLKFIRQREKKERAKREKKARMAREPKEIPKEEVEEVYPHIPETPTIPVIPLGSKGNLKPTQLAAIGWKQSQKIKEQEQIIREKNKQLEDNERKIKSMEKRFDELDAQPRPAKKGKKGARSVKEIYSTMTPFEANAEHIRVRRYFHERKGKEWLESPAHHGTKDNPNVCPCGIAKPEWATSKHEQPMQKWIDKNRMDNFDKSQYRKKKEKEEQREQTDMLEPQRQRKSEKPIDDTALVVPDELVLPEKPVSDRYTSETKPENKSFLCNKCGSPINYSQFTRTRATGGLGLCRNCENKPDEHLSGGFIQ